MGAEGGGSAQGHSPAHNEAILYRRRGLPHPVPRHPVLGRQVTSLEWGALVVAVGVNGSFVFKAGR